MNSTTDLLRMLGGSGTAARVRPSGVTPPPNASELTRTGSFAQLLAAARKGELGGGNPVTVRPEAGVELSPDQLQRLTVAADMAQTAGATRALVRIDGKTLLMDVGARSITASISPAPGEVVTGIDSVIDVPQAPGSPTVSGVTQGSLPLNSPALTSISRSLAEALGAA